MQKRFFYYARSAFKATQTLVFQFILMSYYFVTLRVTFLRACSVRFFLLAHSLYQNFYAFFFLLYLHVNCTQKPPTQKNRTQKKVQLNRILISVQVVFYVVQFFLCNSALKIGKCYFVYFFAISFYVCEFNAPSSL